MLAAAYQIFLEHREIYLTGLRNALTAAAFGLLFSLQI